MTHPAPPDLGPATPAVYLVPPDPIHDVLRRQPHYAFSVSPTRGHLLLMHLDRYPAIADLAAPTLRLAGLRINPRTFGPHLPANVRGLSLQSLTDPRPQPVALTIAAPMTAPVWSPDGRLFACTHADDGGSQLWIGEVATTAVRRIDGIRLNATLGNPVEWLPDGRSLLCETVAARGWPPAAPAVPTGPIVQESAGRAGPVRTFQDLLRSPHDEALFDYYCTSQLVILDVETGASLPLGPPGIFVEVEPSPGGDYFLVARAMRPYSYLHPFTAFPRLVEVWDRAGRPVHTVARLALQDRVPIEGVPTGPRSIQWRPDAPATLVWVEALDEGDPRAAVPHRDRLMAQTVAPAGEPVEWSLVEHRFAGLTWGEADGLAVLRDYDRDRRWGRTFLIDRETTRLLWERSVQDRYGDPGTPFLRTLPNGQRVLWQDGDGIFLVGNGATPEGDRPFLDRFDLRTCTAERLFRCGEGEYEMPIALLADDGSRFLTRHESSSCPPNGAVRAAGGSRRWVTEIADAAPQLRAIAKRLVSYRRADGVPLSFTLYLPPGYQEGTRLPTVVWAYPQEFASADTAGQVAGSPHRFTAITGSSHLFFLLAGYAVLDNATMPVVGPPETANDTFIEQVVASARAAIDTAAELGVTDPARVGIGGHSYGAFMATHLLAHSNLFRAGIARSGAYNRTLTPFGFQNERRTLWDAPEVYAQLSPFTAAHKIAAPLLLIHGESDNNPGTFPMQSERMYQAVRGNGGTVRLVVLPHEGHGYVALESVGHVLAEMIAWFDRYVK